MSELRNMIVLGAQLMEHSTCVNTAEVKKKNELTQAPSRADKEKNHDSRELSFQRVHATKQVDRRA